MEKVKKKEFGCYGFTLNYNDSAVFEDNFERHCHSDVEFIMIFDGDLDIIIEEKQSHVAQPCLVVLLPTVYHSVFPKRKSHYVRLTNIFPKENIPCAIYQEFCEKVKNNPIFVTEQIINIQKKLKAILLKEDTEKYAPYINSILTEMFYIIAENNDNNAAITKQDDNIYKIITYINDNLDKIIFTKEIAEFLFLSESSVNHLFKQKMNITIKQYILSKKMILAETMLNDGESAISVANKLGYTNYTNFCSVYKKIMHKYPKSKKSIN